MRGAPLYRPTPTLRTFGGNPTVAGPVSNGLRGGEMRGVVLGWDYKSASDQGKRATQGNPWIISSGTMGRFVLGDDSFDLSPFDPGTPDFSAPDFSSGPDFGLPDFYAGASASPIAPTSTLQTGVQAPDLGIPTFGPSAPIVSAGSPIAPVAPTPAVSSAGAAATAVAPAPSLAQSIANLFKPSAPTIPATMKTAVVPASGLYSIAPAGTSFLTQSTIVPGMPNSTVLIGGVVLLAFLAAMGSSRK